MNVPTTFGGSVASAAHCRRRPSPVRAPFAAALVAALAVPALAFGAAAPAAAGGVLPALPSPSTPPSTTPSPTASLTTEPPPSESPNPSESPSDPAEPPVDPTRSLVGQTRPPVERTAPPIDQTRPPIDEPGEREPAGRPIAGIALSSSDVVFATGGQPARLWARLSNTGATDATGRVEIILPEGVTVQAPPAGCGATGSGRTACAFSRIRAGQTVQLHLRIEATVDAQQRAPLAGAVVATLTSRSGAVKRMQVSFRITAPSVLPAEDPASGAGGALAAGNGSPDGHGAGVRRLAIGLITVSGLLVVLALALAMTSLRRLGDDAASPLPTRSAPAD
jgi:hypothetical protein